MTTQRNNIDIKNKFVNHLTINGKKNKSEKIVYKSVKTLQVVSKKSSRKLIQLALVFNTPIFKLNTITQKKRKKKKQKARIIPAFISNKASRISSAAKFIVTTAQKNKNQPLFQTLSEEIVASSQKKSDAIEIKKETQKQALLNQRLFKYYRWH